MAKARAMKIGLSLASRMGCNQVQEESDSIETVEACAGEEAWRSESTTIFADCVDSTMLTGNIYFTYHSR
jgi:hypothetical protein